MRHIGELLKNYIETNRLVKGDIAKECGITYNYLSAIFHKPSIDCALYEKICNAIGMNPNLAFEGTYDINNRSEEIQKDKYIEMLEKLIAEKERLIQVLLQTSGTYTEQCVK